MPHHPTSGSGPNLFGPMVPGKEPTSITAIGIKATGIESDPVASISRSRLTVMQIAILK